MAYVQHIQQAAFVCLIYHLPSDGWGRYVQAVYKIRYIRNRRNNVVPRYGGLTVLLQGDDEIGMSAKYTVHATGVHPRPANGSVLHHISSANDRQDCQPELPLEPPTRRQETPPHSHPQSPIPFLPFPCAKRGRGGC